MKEILKKSLVLLMAFGMMTMSACSVSQEKNPGTSTEPSTGIVTEPSTDPGTDTGSETEPPVVTPPVVEVDVDKKIEDFYAVRDLAATSRNFAAELKKGEKTEEWKVNQNAVLIDENRIFSFEDGKNYFYNLETEGWVREETENENPANELVNWISSLEIVSYEKESDSFTGGDKNNHVVVMYQTESGFYFSDGETAVNVTDITKTNVKLPENWTEKKIDDPEPPIVDSLVDENGHYNLSLMKDLVWNWIKNDNQFGKDVLAYRSRNDLLETQRILFVNPTNDNLRFGAVIKNQNGTYYNVYAVEDVDYTSREKFVESLKSFTSRQDVKVIYDNVEIDTTVSDEDVATRTANVMNFLGKGDEEAVDVCESVKIGSSLTYGNGIGYRQLIVTKNSIYFVTIDALSKNDVLENTDKWDAEITKTEAITKTSPEKTK